MHLAGSHVAYNCHVKLNYKMFGARFELKLDPEWGAKRLEMGDNGKVQ